MANNNCIISINIHCNFPFLLYQLQNLKTHLSFKYAVILNCNKHMFDQCLSSEKKHLLDDNVFVNPEHIEKRRFHGSLTQGIYSNIKFAKEHFIEFDAFLILSSRTVFGRPMNVDDLNQTVLRDRKYKYSSSRSPEGWHWWAFLRTKLAAKISNQDMGSFCGAFHEGLMFTNTGCARIVEYLEQPENQDIKEDLFSTRHSVEEFALQTIIHNCGESYYYIGNGCGEDRITSASANHIFTHKIQNSARGFTVNSPYLNEAHPCGVPIESAGCLFIKHHHDGAIEDGSSMPHEYVYEYEFMKGIEEEDDNTTTTNPYRWMGWDFLPSSMNTTMKFDICFLSEVPLPTDHFAVKTHRPHNLYVDWLTQCRKDEFSHIEIPLFLSDLAAPQLLLFFADQTIVPVHFRVKNVAFVSNFQNMID